MSNPNTKKSGIAVLVGRSNVGKSTLLNALVGTKVAITTPKPQTTRLPIHGILTAPEGQIVFVDTPGIFKNAKDALSKKLNSSIRQSLEDVNAVIYVADPTRAIGDEEKELLRMIESLAIPKIMVINKSDLEKKPFADFYRDLAPKFAQVFELSAISNAHIKPLIEAIFALLPEGEPLYPEFQFTNLENKKWIAELIREKLFLRLRQEVPYTLTVEVDEVEERENGILYIHARILTTEERYQRMIIGKGARGVKEIGQSTRNELEAVMNRKIFLDLTVDVDPHWVERME